MTLRAVVVIDYQNVHLTARDIFYPAKTPTRLSSTQYFSPAAPWWPVTLDSAKDTPLPN